ncbi:enoyl-CoA hydratase/isomerase family protein [Nakamurella sp. GG22]
MSQQNDDSVSVSVDPHGWVGTIILDRGVKHHSLQPELLTELEVRLDEVAGSGVRVIILRTASVGRLPNSTLPARSRQAPLDETWRPWTPVGHRVFDRITQLTQPTIAVVDGLSIGGGAELALSCDFRVATDRARIGPSQVGLGAIPGWAGTRRLTQIIGPARANYLMRTLRCLDAPTAASWGLVTSVAPAHQIDNHLDQLVESLLGSTSISQQDSAQSTDTASSAMR